MSFPRMVSQLSTFTIHPKPLTRCTIPELLEDETNLVRYIIPSENKDQLRKDLSKLGITHRTLFQDLESISVSIRQEARIVAYSPPNPPKCDGECDGLLK
jgi:hypothetical protein